MRISKSPRPRRMVGKNVSIRPDQEAWIMNQAAENQVTFSEAIRAVVDRVMETENVDP